MKSEANLFEFWGRGIHVTYSTSSITGVPLLAYRAYGVEKSFKGDEIQVSETRIGREVTVTLETVPDLKSVTFTVLVPKVNITDDHRRVRIRSVGIHADHFTSIGGPNLVPGPLASYDGNDLTGIAQAVNF